jgi:CheY-like chemotaxis protein
MKKILVIEDEHQLRSDLIEIFGFEGYATVGADNGQVGILCAQVHQPDLIICDIMMPVMDGFALITALCQNPQTNSIPVIFLSAHNDQATVQKGLQLGAVACLPKPYNLTDLLTTVRTQIGD